MEIFDTWFEIDESATDADNVFRFLRGVPEKIQELTKESNSNFFQQLRNADSRDINTEIFLAALDAARRVLFLNLEFIQGSYYNDPEFRNQFESRLRDIGFTNQSLILKAAVLNAHWRTVKRRVGNGVDAIIDFAGNPLAKLLRRFLQYLNSILGSLTSLIPGGEAIKEIKEIIESFVGIADA